MNQHDPVRARVTELAHGRRRNRRLTVFVRTLFYGLCAAAVLGWFIPAKTTLLLVIGLVVAALIVALVAASMIPVDPVVVAKRFDDKAGTKDLLSSSLELGDEADPFVAAVREDASATAAGSSVTAGEVFPIEVPAETRWMPVPIVVCAAAVAFVLFTAATPVHTGPSPAEIEARLAGAQRILDLASRLGMNLLSELGAERLRGLKEIAETLELDEVDKKDVMAELAKLASQLDKQRQELEGKKLEAEKNATRLAKGEDIKDAKRDMEGGKFREAANKVKKQIKQLEKKLQEAIKNKASKLEIERLRQRLEQLKELLAELEQLDALGKELGFLVEVLDALDMIEGELGELGDFDGMEFDDVQLGRPQQGRQGDPQEMRQLFAYPSNDAGEGHNTTLLGKARRALTEREEQEAKLREGKGKSSFGQVKTANDRSRSQQEYREALLAAKQAAEDAVYRQNIPAGYRNYIRRYFETMQPDERSRSNEGK